MVCYKIVHDVLLDSMQTTIIEKLLEIIIEKLYRCCQFQSSSIVRANEGDLLCIIVSDNACQIQSTNSLKLSISYEKIVFFCFVPGVFDHLVLISAFLL